MASSSKPTGVHYALIVFVLISIALGVCLLLAYKGSGSIGEMKAREAAANKKASEAENLSRKLLDQIAAVKRQLGSKFDEVGDDAGKANTVLHDMDFHIKSYGRDVAKPTYNETIVKLHEALRNASDARDALQATLQKELDLFKREKDQLNAELNTAKTARDTADTRTRDADSKHSEELARKEAVIAEVRKDLEQTRQDYTDLQDTTNKKIKDFETRVSTLLATNQRLNDDLQRITRGVFDRANGEIVTVDGTSKRVWINLGEVHGLRPRVTFSVYKRNNKGVGRASAQNALKPEDIKGKIEVTKVGPDMAEARIIETDMYDPMGPGDPLYSPVWSPGRGEAFSIIGDIDIDGDGKSDRALFHEIVATQGGIIDNEVDDKGNLFVDGKPADSPKITERTKFLVVGRVPDFDHVDTDHVKTVERINKLQKELDQQARERGVRIVSLSDFLNFIGYKPQRRLYLPGDTKYNLQQGVPRPSYDTTGTSTATGNVSGTFSDENLTKSRGPTGNTSGGYSGETSKGQKLFRKPSGN